MKTDSLAAAAQQALCRTETVTDLYTERGDCKGCGQCCSRFIPMSVYDAARLVRYVEDHGIEQRAPRGGEHDIDLTCPYLDDDLERMVYEARPEICRIYRCDQHAHRDLKPLLFMDTMSLVDLRGLAS